jgi:ABC-2 type transport system ATP-binding protein
MSLLVMVRFQLDSKSGTLTLNGFNVVKQQDQTRQSFGIVFQDPSLDNDLTAYENMQLHAVMYGVPNKNINERIKDLLTLVELWERKDSLVKTYSGGMKRRLEIARGLLHHPKVLFLDEPTLGLDTQTRNLLWNYVSNLAHEKDMTILFTTHYLEEAEANANKIAIIDHGQLLTIGTAKELMNQTKTTTLEAAYLSLTGKELRDEKVDPHEFWRERQRSRNMR